MVMPTPAPTPSFGTRCFASFLAAGLVKADTPKKEQIIGLIDAEFAKAKPPRAKPVTGPGLDDEAWIKTLEDSPAMLGVDVRQEIAKCRLWTSNAYNGRQPTRMRIVNWLNKTDRSLLAARSSPGQAQVSPYKEPAVEWLGTALELLPDCDLADRIRDGLAWGDLPIDFRKKLINHL